MRDDYDQGIYINSSFCINKIHKSLNMTKKREKIDLNIMIVIMTFLKL